MRLQKKGGYQSKFEYLFIIRFSSVGEGIQIPPICTILLVKTMSMLLTEDILFIGDLHYKTVRVGNR